jgi:hypothetical protein
MPKPPLRDNPHRHRSALSGQRAQSKPFEIKDLLNRHGLGVEARKTQVQTEEHWQVRFRTLAPSALAAAVLNIIEREGTLVFYVTSASWASRLRYELPSWWPALIEGIHPAPSGWRVQIQPAAASTGARA